MKKQEKLERLVRLANKSMEFYWRLNNCEGTYNKFYISKSGQLRQGGYRSSLKDLMTVLATNSYDLIDLADDEMLRWQYDLN